MSAGKIASQAGHAYVGAILSAQSSNWPALPTYAQLIPGTKVCLQGSLDEIYRAYERLQQAGIPAFLVVDSGCPNFFAGEPTVTALGFGPALKHQVKNITKKLQLL